ncbi:hypothetical protein, partial [Raoultella ornithinolytica]|uniref:hypothetical protein n=1 Tax=Raoultella ornithinolytica TaxID=54291 RepID=UPI00197DC4D5
QMCIRDRAVRFCLVTSARAAPLILAFGGLVVLTLRNHLPFTCVHSHPVAQKSSAAYIPENGDES